MASKRGSAAGRDNSTQTQSKTRLAAERVQGLSPLQNGSTAWPPPVRGEKAKPGAADSVCCALVRKPPRVRNCRASSSCASFDEEVESGVKIEESLIYIAPKTSLRKLHLRPSITRRSETPETQAARSPRPMSEACPIKSWKRTDEYDLPTTLAVSESGVNPLLGERLCRKSFWATENQRKPKWNKKPIALFLLVPAQRSRQLTRARQSPRCE